MRGNSLWSSHMDSFSEWQQWVDSTYPRAEIADFETESEGLLLT